MVCHEPMRQEFDVIKVAVIKDTQDNTRRGRHRRGGEEFLGFGLKWLVASLFIAAMIAVIFGLSCFLREVFLATRASRIELARFT